MGSLGTYDDRSAWLGPSRRFRQPEDQSSSGRSGRPDGDTGPGQTGSSAIPRMVFRPGVLAFLEALSRYMSRSAAAKSCAGWLVGVILTTPKDAPRHGMRLLVSNKPASR